MSEPKCAGCGKSPAELDEYVHNPDDDPDPVAWCRENEGTFNHENGHFLCTACYIRSGSPSSPKGWVCP